MAVLASQLLSETKILLNDKDGIIYTTAKLLPLLQKAYRELQQKMRKAGMDVTRESTDIIDIPANLSVLVDGDGYMPDDLVFPLEIHERENEDGDFIELQKAQWVPVDSLESDQTNTVGIWVWREGEIKLNPVNNSRQLLIRYHKSLPILTSDTTPVQVKGAETFLVSRCGAIAAMVIGENTSRADSLNTDAKEGWEDLKTTRVTAGQATPVRRVVNRYRVDQ